MPKLTLLLGRRTMQAYDFKQPSIVVGRDEGADVLIDNPSVSRRHAEIRLGDNGWEVEDLGSSNGTFLRGHRIEGPQSIGLGDEIGFGKFSIVFGKALGETRDADARAFPPTARVEAGPDPLQRLGNAGQRLVGHGFAPASSAGPSSSSSSSSSTHSPSARSCASRRLSLRRTRKIEISYSP